MALRIVPAVGAIGSFLGTGRSPQIMETAGLGRERPIDAQFVDGSYRHAAS